uniref:Uncharacterized protein n=1 Tax=Anguilla anguilla TaxID=7936 RepID=A0A0E9PLM1_ANGAN
MNFLQRVKNVFMDLLRRSSCAGKSLLVLMS